MVGDGVRPVNETAETSLRAPGVKWNPWIGVLLVLAIYVFSQIVGLVVLIYPILRHWSAAKSSSWFNNSTYAQFFYVFIVEAFTVLAVLQLLKWFKVDKKVIGLRKPRFKDLLYAVIGALVYFFLYFFVVIILSTFVKGLNVSENQNVGFNSVHGVAQLIVTFVSLVILPPIAEEVLVRGFLYSSLKKGLPQIAAFIATSLIFASAHLPEGTAGLLWIGFIDTFILSIVLIYLREKTDGLWSSMTLHGIKNAAAYVVLYIASIAAFRI
jgi:membrane protease YdiL (CAAX protease family)